jgi:dTMP kinase
MSKGTFVVFEGGEGAGKSTQAQMLYEALQCADRPALLTREPGATPLGQRIRHLLLSPEPEPHLPGNLPHPPQLVIPPMAELLLYAADRAAHVEQVIRPALARGDVVICDRYVDSSVAYQGGGRGVQQVLLVCEIATGFLQPDLVVLLDIDPQEGLARIRDRAADRIEAEQLEFHHRVRAGFLARATAVSVAAGARHRRYMVADATQPPQVIAAQVKDRVSELLFQRVRGKVAV